MLLGCPWSAELDCVSNGDGDEVGLSRSLFVVGYIVCSHSFVRVCG